MSKNAHPTIQLSSVSHRYPTDTVCNLTDDDNMGTVVLEIALDSRTVVQPLSIYVERLVRCQWDAVRRPVRIKLGCQQEICGVEFEHRLNLFSGAFLFDLVRNLRAATGCIDWGTTARCNQSRG
jgi:hypothetical protein